MSSLLSTTLHAYPASILKRTQLRHQHLDRKFLRKKIDQRRTPQRARASWQVGGDDFRTLKRIMRLNSAFQNRNVKALFELASDECKYFCNSLPAIDLLGLSKKVFGIIIALMVRNNVMFVIKPSIHNGVDVGVKWMLEWKDNNLPLGFGLNVNTTHIYKGMVFIKKGDNKFGPLLTVKNLQLDLEEILLPIIDKVLPQDVLKGKRVIIMYCLLSLIVMVISYVLLKNTP
ncbi:uncharacterized protein [Typha angustifolia]|uniref:uncharacterized protein n=1 Tax=Typha angustifolia TaxID=59011 RepID=UPI003C2BC58C